MAVSAASTYALSNLAKQDAAFVRQALSDVGAGDQLALQALAERSGIADPAQLQEAARLYAEQKLDVIFQGAGDARTRAAIGRDAAPAFAPGAGGVSGAKMSAFIGLRGGGAADAALAGKLGELAKLRDAKQAERAPLDAQRTTLKTELEGLHLNRRERWLGSWAGVLGGDSDKGEKGKKLSKEIDGLDAKLGAIDGEIAGFVGQMHDATAKHLKAAGDRDFLALDGEWRTATQAKDALEGLARTVRSARSRVSSAESAERQEMYSEQSAKGKDEGSWEANNERWSEANARMAVSSAESAIREVQAEAREVAAKLRDLGKGADLGSVHTTDMGKMFDVMLDALGMDDGNWFFGSDAMVLNNLSQADRELSTLQDRVQRALSGVDAEHTAASAARTSYLEDAEAKLLAAR